MKIALIVMGGCCWMAAPVLSAEPLSMPAAVSPTSPSSALSPASPSAAAAFLSVTAASPLSGSAAALTPTSDDQGDVEDDALTATVVLDLGQADTGLLARIADALKPDQESVFYNVADDAPASVSGAGVSTIDAGALYAELGKRAVAEDKEARQALAMATLRGDPRASAAKEEAFEERVADSLIERIENGDKGAKDELTKEALKGNSKARAYLGLDHAPVAVGIPEATTPTSAAPQPSLATPSAASPASPIPQP
jgi:hypothetical protein